METVRIAVLGMNQGEKNARDAIANPEVNLVAVAGFGEHDAKVAEELHVPIYSDYTLLLKQEQLDGVVIALPNSLHEEATRLSLDAGIKTIWLEKPIANTVEEGERIVAMCQEAGATLLIGHHRRNSARYQLLRKVIDSGRLGNIVGIQSTYAIAKANSYFDVEWRTKKGAGPLLINSVHDFDDLNYVTGLKPVKVYASAHNTIRGNEVEDTASAIVEYEGGVTCTYFVSDGTPSPWNYDLQANENVFLTMSDRPENSMLIFGTKGSFGFPNMDLYYYDEDHYGWWEPMKHEHFTFEHEDPYVLEMAHFVDLIKGRETTPRCTGADGLETVKVINAIAESAETGMPVFIK